MRRVLVGPIEHRACTSTPRRLSPISAPMTVRSVSSYAWTLIR
jgi:hypothetical protein